MNDIPKYRTSDGPLVSEVGLTIYRTAQGKGLNTILGALATYFADSIATGEVELFYPDSKRGSKPILKLMSRRESTLVTNISKLHAFEAAKSLRKNVSSIHFPIPNAKFDNTNMAPSGKDFSYLELVPDKATNNIFLHDGDEIRSDLDELALTNGISIHKNKFSRFNNVAIGRFKNTMDEDELFKAEQITYWLAKEESIHLNSSTIHPRTT